jgi:hypothetical protein
MENTYVGLLALVYFQGKGKEYDLSELRYILGLTQFQLDELIYSLFEKSYLEYIDYEMCLSEKGLSYINQKQALKHEYESDEKHLSVIHKEKAISLDTIYVPKKFDRKI